MGLMKLGWYVGILYLRLLLHTSQPRSSYGDDVLRFLNPTHGYTHNGNSFMQGVIEMKQNWNTSTEMWKQVCALYFTDENAHVVCRMGGFYTGEYSSGKYNAEMQAGGLYASLGMLTCRGTETDLDQCKGMRFPCHSQPVGPHRKLVIGLRCYSKPCVNNTCPAHSYCRNNLLQHGSSQQVCTCFNGYHGPACTDVNECEMSSHDCDKHANCTNTVGSFTCHCHDGFVGDGKFCKKAPIHRRGPIRFPNPEIIKGKYLSYIQGHIEVQYNGMWGTLCDDSFDDSAANVLCRMGGYLYGVYHRGQYSQPDVLKSRLIWLDDVVCTGKESSIGDCKHGGWGVHNCDHREDVGVKCYEKDVCYTGEYGCHNGLTCVMGNGRPSCVSPTRTTVMTTYTSVNKIKHHSLTFCDFGFRKIGSQCVDINECRFTICAGNATCHNTHGSYKCKCNPGFIGNGDTRCTRCPGDCKDSENLWSPLVISVLCAVPAVLVVGVAAVFVWVKRRHRAQQAQRYETRSEVGLTNTARHAIPVTFNTRTMVAVIHETNVPPYVDVGPFTGGPPSYFSLFPSGNLNFSFMHDEPPPPYDTPE